MNFYDLIVLDDRNKLVRMRKGAWCPLDLLY